MTKATFFLAFTFVDALIFVFIEVYLIRRGKQKLLTQTIAKQWPRVCRMIDQNPKSAVVEADKLLEFALRQPKKRTSVGDTLKTRGASIFSDIDGVWRVHKLRNRIVHEIGFEITEKDARDALRIFKHALGELGVKFPRSATRL